MEIKNQKEGDQLTINLVGRLDTNTAPELEKELETLIDDSVKTAILDLKELDYVSSAGLRVILGLQKQMSGKSGSLTVRGANESIIEVFEMTGFLDILNVEK
jgi:anti-sigma B factor antagonist